MPNEREYLSALTAKDYSIAGNDFRAYYDAANKLVFVVDNTVDARKPNVMLIINPVGDRKWDDVLANDYSVDLETVRPKKDNKYQKLDIEYSGLSDYGELIRRYEAGDDLTAALAALSDFRNAAACRAASERLAAADDTADKARDTILKTHDSIAELQVRLKQLRAKLSQQKKAVGKEPTKQSAAKILRTESQIDATNEKMRRAKKRLVNAQKRLVAADEDAQVARGILTRCAVSAPDAGMPPHGATTMPAAVAPQDLVAVQPAPVPAEIEPEFKEVITETQDYSTEQKANEMADEEVKPLFDKDPEILDEEIAFKPIEFNTDTVSSAASVNAPVDTAARVDVDVYNEPVAPSPLSFTPPVSKTDAASDAEVSRPAPIEVRPIADVPQSPMQSQPVLDTITSVDMPSDDIAPAAQTTPTAAQRPAPVMPDVPGPVQPAPEPGIAPAPVSSDFRPVSPITGGVAPVSPQPAKKQTLLYYVMLVVLIALSIFTLWLYQKNTSDNMPDLATTTPQPQAEATTPSPAPVDTIMDSQDSPFIPVVEEPAASDSVDDAPVQVEEVETVQIAEPTPDTEPEPVVEPEPVPVSAPVEDQTPAVVQPEPAPVPVTPAAESTTVENVQESPLLAPEPATETVADVQAETPDVAELVVDKPAYNVSQQENMFIAAPEYETDAEFYAEEDAESCSDGGAPDANGCCAGEIFTAMDDGTFACCLTDGSECYPPMF